MTPPASGAPRTTIAPRARSTTRRSRRASTSSRNAAADPAAAIATRRRASRGARISCQDESSPAKSGGPLESPERPGDDGLANIRTVAAHGDQGGFLCSSRAPARTATSPVGVVSRSARARAAVFRTRRGVVVEGSDHDRGPRHRCRVDTASASTAAARTLGEGSSRSRRTRSIGTGSPSRRSASRPAIRSRSSGPRRADSATIARRARIGALRREEAREGRPDPGTRVAGQLADRRDGGRWSLAGSSTTAASVRTAASRTRRSASRRHASAAAAAGGGPPSVASASSAATRTRDRGRRRRPG